MVKRLYSVVLPSGLHEYAVLQAVRSGWLAGWGGGGVYITKLIPHSVSLVGDQAGGLAGQKKMGWQARKKIENGLAAAHVKNMQKCTSVLSSCVSVTPHSECFQGWGWL